MSSPLLTFRLRFLRPALIFSCVTFAFTECLIFFTHGPNFPANSEALLVARGVVLVFGFAFVWLLTFWCRVKLSPDGIRCCDSFGLRRFFSWQDMYAVQRCHMPGFPFLVIRSKSRAGALWLPLFLKDLAGFARLVRASAGAQHVLARALPE